MCWGEVLEIVGELLNHTKSSESKAMVDVGLGLVAWRGTSEKDQGRFREGLGQAWGGGFQGFEVCFWSRDSLCAWLGQIFYFKLKGSGARDWGGTQGRCY